MSHERGRATHAPRSPIATLRPRTRFVHSSSMQILTRALPLLWLASSLVLASPAAQDDAATLPAQAPKAEARPFLFEITGNGSTAWLLGTVHLADKRVLALPAVVESAFVGSDAVFTEIETTTATEIAFQRASMIEGGKKLGDVVGSELAARVRTRVQAAGLPQVFGDTMMSMKPWVVTTALPLLDRFLELSTKPPLDKVLFDRARKAGKAVGGIETVQEQVGVFDGLTAQEQTAMLRDTLDLLDRYEAEGRDPIEELVAAWLSGDEARLLDLLAEGFGDDPELSKRIEHDLVWKRNVRMADRIDAQIKADPARECFFAVGALHVPDARLGDDATEEQRLTQRGVVTLLRAKGYEVRRVTTAAPAAVGGDK